MSIRRSRCLVAIALVPLLLACGSGSGGDGGGGDVFVYDGPDDLCFILPHGGAAPAASLFSHTGDAAKLDVYLLLDTTASMNGELAAIASSIATALNNVICAPAGGGAAPACTPSLFVGLGALGTSDGTPPPFQHLRDVQAGLPAVFPMATNDGTREVTYAAIWSAVTGNEVSGSGCVELMGAASAGLCVGGRGGVCFRDDSLAVIVVVTDEAPSANLDCPASSLVQTAARSAGVRIVGILGSSPMSLARPELEALAAGSGAVDAMGNPLVLDGGDSAAPTAIATALQTLLTQTPIDVGVRLVDEPGDAGDSLQFFDRFATVQMMGGGCSTGLVDIDTNADGTDDQYVGVAPQTPLCWSLVPLANTTVPQTAAAQVFKARIEIIGDGVAVLGTFSVAFVVPPL